MTTELSRIQTGALPPCPKESLERVMAMRGRISEMPPAEFPTEDFLHAGCYVRTCLVPKDTVLAGAVIKVPTVLVVSGDCFVYTGGDEVKRISGYAVLRGDAGRTGVFRAVEDTYLTMFYASGAKTTAAAEEEFTDEYDKLLTRRKE